MDDWISLDTFLDGNHLEIQVAEEEMWDQIMSNNPKFLSEAELEGLQNPEVFTIYFEIDADGDAQKSIALPCFRRN